MSLRPFYLPREFSNILICSVYVTPNSNASKAAADCVDEQLQHTPNAPIFIMGDFNRCNLNNKLPGFEQYIKCDTRKNLTFKFYGNVNMHTQPLLNHPCLTLTTTPYTWCLYTRQPKSSKPLVKSINAWTEDSLETLNGCFLCTDWYTFSGEPNLDSVWTLWFQKRQKRSTLTTNLTSQRRWRTVSAGKNWHSGTMTTDN